MTGLIAERTQMHHRCRSLPARSESLASGAPLFSVIYSIQIRISTDNDYKWIELLQRLPCPEFILTTQNFSHFTVRLLTNADNIRVKEIPSRVSPTFTTSVLHPDCNAWSCVEDQGVGVFFLNCAHRFGLLFRSDQQDDVPCWARKRFGEEGPSGAASYCARGIRSW